MAQRYSSGLDLGMITRCMKRESGAMQIIEFVDKGFRSRTPGDYA